MNAAILALAVGTILAIGALTFVLYPLFFGAPNARRLTVPVPGAWSDDVAVTALREIEFDRATGKLSEADYKQLKEQYTRQAPARMRRSPAGERPEPVEDELEAMIRAYRAERPFCELCGPRPEVNASFCSNCGRYLAGRCDQCGRQVNEIGARFCAACGHRLAA